VLNQRLTQALGSNNSQKRAYKPLRSPNQTGVHLIVTYPPPPPISPLRRSLGHHFPSARRQPCKCITPQRRAE
jgi:hypothetical protein